MKILQTMGGLLALVLVAPFFIVQSISHFTTLSKRAFIESAAMILLGVWFFEGVRSRTLEIRKCAFYLPLGLFLGWGWLSLTWTLSVYDAITYLLHWTACGIIFFLAVQLLGNRRRIEILMKTLVLASVLVALLGFIQYLFKVDWIRQAASPAATFGNRNMASHFIVLTGEREQEMSFMSANGRSRSPTATLTLRERKRKR